MPTFVKRTAPAAILVIAILALATIIQENTTANAQTSICADTKAVPADASAELLNDCDALISSKGAIKGSGSLNWWAGKSMSQWNGITVTNNRVTGLDLRDRGLDGTIPERIAELNALLDLYLSGNTFTGCIPAGLSDVTNNDVAAAGLSFCGSTGEPDPTPPAATPTPPTPQQGETEFVDHCQAADIETVHGDTYSLQREIGPYDWDHNGRGWKRTYSTTWTSETYASVVQCTTLVFDNADSAYLETSASTLLWFLTAGSSDVLDHWRIRNYEFEGNDFIPVIGDRAIGIKMEEGRKRSFIDDETQEWVQVRFGVGTTVMFQYGDEAFIVSEYISLGDIEDSSLGPPSAARSVELAQLIESRLYAATSTSSKVSTGTATGTAQEWFESRDTLDALKIERRTTLDAPFPTLHSTR